MSKNSYLERKKELDAMDVDEQLGRTASAERRRKQRVEEKQRMEALRKEKEEFRAWLESEEKSMAMILERDAYLKTLENLIPKEQVALDQLIQEYGKTQAEIAEMQAKRDAPLTDAKVGDLRKAAQAAATSVDLSILKTVEKELQRRIELQQESLNQAIADHDRARRIVVHRHLDKLIEATREPIQALSDLFDQITRLENWVRDNGGSRHTFFQTAIRERMKYLLEKFDSELRDISELSEQY